MGLDPLLLSFIVVIIGGLGSLRGTVVAALLIGLSRRHHLGVLLADAGQDHRDAASSPGAGLPAAGPVRHGARDDGTTRSSRRLPACRASSRCSSRSISCCPTIITALLARIMVLAVFAMGYNCCSAMSACSASATRCSSPPGSTAPGLADLPSRLERAGGLRRRHRLRRRALAGRSACWRCAPPASPS